MYTVDGATAVPATPISLSDAGLRERDDLQEWVIAHPEILGPDVLVITFEYDRWRSSTGDRERDRLDVLGIDRDGRLVVAELKRDKAPETVEMQAIKYAALASRFTEDDLVEQLARSLRQRTGSAVEEDEARATLLDWVVELDAEVLSQPRIVLVAGSFPPVVTSTVHWLNQMGVHITLQSVQAYRVFEDRTIVTVSQLYPLPEVEELLVSPSRVNDTVDAKQRRRREGSTVVRLVRSGQIADGTELVMRPTTSVDASTRSEIEAWLADNPDRARAVWRNDSRAPIEWAVNGERYRPTALVNIALAAVGVTRSVRGPEWWVLPDGRSLVEAAGPAAGGAFDWGPLHAAMAALPTGRWTTYGDLAAQMGTAAQPLGQHIANCPDCPNAQRVLGSDGRPRPNFAWSDPTDRRTQREALEGEGVTFSDGRASTRQRLAPSELAAVTG
ncbi:MGMT family protein [Aquihabitans sp. G128]|uniref:MGMT family protein n=1 Tax=Aquihabitans sp. G128 TaxID=2849779 RepID=UPI001C21736D|nr:MGMT family protein [Aquihabitans sp. G128]QXC60785.1 MGMT family protein [Aquihabitans sp. G128]